MKKRITALYIEEKIIWVLRREAVKRDLSLSRVVNEILTNHIHKGGDKNEVVN